MEQLALTHLSAHFSQQLAVEVVETDLPRLATAAVAQAWVAGVALERQVLHRSMDSLADKDHSVTAQVVEVIHNRIFNLAQTGLDAEALDQPHLAMELQL
jgi:hypothetical protein